MAAKAPTWLWPALAIVAGLLGLLALVNYLFSQTGSAVQNAVNQVTAAADKLLDPAQDAAAKVDAYTEALPSWTEAATNIFDAALWEEAWDMVTGDDS